MALEKIILYHGGHRDKVLGLDVYGLNQNTPFYCTRSCSLAREAENSYGLEGTMFKLEVPKEIFDECLAAGYWIERPYMGCIPMDHSTEVVINQGEGIKIMNKVIATERKTF
jgi:hypothetical protein